MLLRIMVLLRNFDDRDTQYFILVLSATGIHPYYPFYCISGYLLVFPLQYASITMAYSFDCEKLQVKYTEWLTVHSRLVSWVIVSVLSFGDIFSATALLLLLNSSKNLDTSNWTPCIILLLLFSTVFKKWNDFLIDP